MRELRTTSAVLRSGTTKSEIAWAIQKGRWTQVIHGVLGRGPEPPTKLDIARATALVTDGTCHGLVAGELHGFDNVRAGGPEVWVPRSCRSERAGVKRKLHLPRETVTLHQVACTTAADTLLELADRLEDDPWEQALEFCLRTQRVAPSVVASWRHARVRRVLDIRGIEVPPTDSLLETLAVQLIRRGGLPTPVRQYRIVDPHTVRTLARCDLVWPALGIFVELDGQQHKDQPVYDAVRQNLIVRITGWRPIRLTWDQVTLWPTASVRELADLLLPNSLVS
ncbi:MAG TPA: DUF559 domain-containing protein [Acidimicrobiales bacterium]|nr:DUF559 domain-containing protein [Acidimicrobiales bacterium]